MNVRVAGAPAERPEAGKGKETAVAPPEPTSAVAKLQAHFEQLDEASLLRVARAVELARAAERRDPTDEQILETLRPRLRNLRPNRVPTFQRSVCVAVEIFLYDGDLHEEKRKASLARLVLNPWWRVLMGSPHRGPLAALEAEYGKAVREQRWTDLVTIADQGVWAAAQATNILLDEAQKSYGRRGELASILGSDRALEDMKEMGVLLALHAQLTPALDRVRRVAGVEGGGRIYDFTPAAVVAARTAYLNVHDRGADLVEYFFFGLMTMLVQPFQALRLVRMLSQDMSHVSGNHPAKLIPAKLFSDLTRTLSEIGRAAGGPVMARRVWLLTCARLVSDAQLMIKGLSEEVQVEPNPEWQKLLTEARSRVMQAVDGFLLAALQDVALVLPVKQLQEKKGSEVRLEPDMAHISTEEEDGIAQAATVLFTAVKKLMEQEGQDRLMRSKEADLEQRLEIGINFRVEYLRARPKHAVALAHLRSVQKVLKGLPSLNIIRDLEYRVERTLDRYKN
ncbi:hypothetical protein [Niveispirillum sp. KHB5.9]|uniref:hypothetical protein n=1 Tax=Niveispirillum sp. KHB5.9 TaxID=3400269 RepID=UPI003A89E052